MKQRETTSDTTAYIAIGANLGDRERTMRAAIEQLRATPLVTVSRVSTFIENPAVGGPSDSPAFLNGAIEVRTSLPPEAVLDRLLEIEVQLGRVRDHRWSPRTIDLDLLLFGELVMKTERLTVPHPSMKERRFVLAPLVEIAPHAMHPTLQCDVRTLLNALVAH